MRRDDSDLAIEPTAIDPAEDAGVIDDSAIDTTAQPRRRRRVGIGLRLQAAFGGIMALTLLAGGVAWWSYGNIETAFEHATQREVPAMVEALRLQGDATGIAARAPQLATVADDNDRIMQGAAVEAGLDGLTVRLDRLAQGGIEPEIIEGIRREVGNLGDALRGLDAGVSQRLRLTRRAAEQQRGMEEAHRALLQQVVRTLDGAAMELNMGAQQTAMQTQDSIQGLVQHQVSALRASLEAVAEVNSLTGMLAQGTSIDRAAELAALEQAFAERSAVLRGHLDLLPSGAQRNGVIALAEQLDSLGAAEDGIFAQRREYLALANYDLAVELARRRGDINALSEALLAELEPMAQVAYQRVAEGAERATESSAQAVDYLLDSGVSRMVELLRLQAETNLLAGLMSQAAAAADLDALAGLEQRFAETETRARRALEQTHSPQLQSPLETLLGFGVGQEGLFALQRGRIENGAAAELALEGTRRAADRAGTEVMLVVLDAEDNLGRGTAVVGEAILSGKLTLAVIAGSSAVIALLIAWLYVGRRLVRRLVALDHSMRAVADGDLEAEIPTGGRDEITEMAQSLSVFRDGLAAAEEERRANEAERLAAAARRRSEMLDLANGFEASVRGVVDGVSAAATEMQATATSMTGIAEETSRRAAVVASAAEEASGGAQTAASAAQELAGSVSEIGRQVTRSTDIARQANERAEEGNDRVTGLAQAAQKIGDVVKLIQDIAEQTNLLALNATIEAARAGDAGRGFAVVASEVKNLANQTARATEEIAAQIGEMQSATGETVDAIRSITGTISEMSEIASSIAAAVEQQGAATEEIAGTMNRVADGSQAVTENIAGVTQAAQEADNSASQVLSAAEELARQADALRGEVDGFVSRVRAA